MRERAEAEHEEPESDEEQEVLEPGFVEGKMERDERCHGCAEDPECTSIWLPASENDADDDRNAEDGRVVTAPESKIDATIRRS